MWRMMSSDELERQYQPSQWTFPTHRRQFAVGEFVRQCRQSSEQAHRTVSCRSEVQVRHFTQKSANRRRDMHKYQQQPSLYNAEESESRARQSSEKSDMKAHHRAMSKNQEEGGNELDGNTAVTEQLSLHPILWDEFGADLPSSAPLIVFIHGGYWQEMSRQLSAGPALTFSAHMRHRCLIVDYPLAPVATMRQIVAHVREVGRYVRHYLNQSDNIECPQSHSSKHCKAEHDKREGNGHVNSGKNSHQHVVFIGHSAGAQLVAAILQEWGRKSQQKQAAVTSQVPGISNKAAKCRHEFVTNEEIGDNLTVDVVLLSGVYDLEPLVNTTVNNALQMSTLGARHLSPMSHIDSLQQLSHLRQILVLVGENDSPEFKRQSQQYLEAIKIRPTVDYGCHSNGDKSHHNYRHLDDNRGNYQDRNQQIHVMPNHDHFSICQALANPNSDVVNLIKTNIFPQSKTAVA